MWHVAYTGDAPLTENESTRKGSIANPPEPITPAAK
jgi:hypothetical protein